MKDLMRQIDNTIITLHLSLEQTMDLKKVLKKREYAPTRVSDGKQFCPVCGTEVLKGFNYCRCCGQAVIYNEQYDKEDLLPL